MADNSTKDLDFDELHKAVSQLMDKTQKGRAKRAKADTKPIVDEAGLQPKPDNPASGEQVKAAAEPATEENTNITVNVKRPLPSLTNHKMSHGRAMDVIGPREQRQATAPSQAVKRQAQALQPTGPLVVPDREPLAKKPQEPNELDEALASLNKQSNTQPPEGGPTLTHQKDELSETEVASDALKEQADTAKDNEPENTTPFITTKVEKRPLGAYAVAEAPTGAETPKDDQKPQADSPQQAAKEDAPSAVPAQPQPEEFAPAVVAVESTESEATPASDLADQDLRAMGIPQQYHEQQANQDDSPRPVFDTTQYHPAIEAHTTTHRSSAGTWVMGILFVLLLVVVLGAVYYFLTGSLDFTALWPY